MRLRHVARHQRAARAAHTPPAAASPGIVTTRRRGRGIEINDVRIWIDGDDVRHIDANATARTGVPHVRTFRDDHDRTALLFADFRPSMLFGTRRSFRSVAAAEALAIVGWSMVADGRRVGLFAVGPDEQTFIPPRSGERGMAMVIDGLVQSHERALESDEREDKPLDQLLELAVRHLPHGGTLVIASALDEPGPAFVAFMATWARRVSLRVILVSDAFERERRRGWYPFVTGKSRRKWGRIGSDKGSISENARLTLLAECGVNVVRLDSELDPESVVSELELLDVART